MDLIERKKKYKKIKEFKISYYNHKYMLLKKENHKYLDM